MRLEARPSREGSDEAPKADQAGRSVMLLPLGRLRGAVEEVLGVVTEVTALLAQVRPAVGCGARDWWAVGQGLCFMGAWEERSGAEVVEAEEDVPKKGLAVAVRSERKGGDAACRRECSAGTVPGRTKDGGSGLGPESEQSNSPPSMDSTMSLGSCDESSRPPGEERRGAG